MNSDVEAEKKTPCVTRWAALDPVKWEKAVNEMAVEWKRPLQFLEALDQEAGRSGTRRQKAVILAWRTITLASWRHG